MCCLTIAVFVGFAHLFEEIDFMPFKDVIIEHFLHLPFLYPVSKILYFSLIMCTVYIMAVFVICGFHL